MNELEQAITKAKAKYEAQGYSVTIERDAYLTATKGIHKIFEGYYKNGQKVYTRNYKNGKWHGEYKSWYDNGQKAYTHNYKNGKQDGKQFYWNTDGTEKPTLVYKDGKFITEIISKQITYAEYKAIQRSKFWNGVFWIGSIVLFVGLFLADSCFEIKLFD